MSRFVYLIAIVCLFSSCSLFKTKKSYQATDVLNKQDFDIRNEQQLLVIRDSLQEDFVVEIVPLGIFSYSLNKGFRGSGSSIKMIGRKNGTMDVLEKINLANVHQQLEKRTATKNTTNTVIKRKDFRFSIGFYLLLLCAILATLIWLWKKYRKRIIF